ncbi:MAG: L-serine ammonia-lyase, iron-sulfur-dependent, subunit alpha [Promethearchaeota archaeon]
MSENKVLRFLKENVKLAAGCTEIVAIGLSSAAGMNALRKEKKIDSSVINPEELSDIRIILDKNVYKNAYSVEIPQTHGGKGIKLALALGFFLNIDINNVNLEIFSQINEDLMSMSKRIVNEKEIEVDVDPTKRSLYISTNFKYAGHEVNVEIKDMHDKITRINIDGKPIFLLKEEGELSPNQSAVSKEENKERKSSVGIVGLEKEGYTTIGTLGEALEIIESISDEEEKELQKTIDTNKLLVEDGLINTYGMGLVKKLKDLIRKGLIYDDLTVRIKIQVAAAVEARMGGSSYPAMSSSGSGDMGITATVPIIVIAENAGSFNITSQSNIDRHRLLKAILLSHIVTNIASKMVGRLSSLCGTYNKAALGAAAGICYLLGGGKKEIENAIKVIEANVTGVICDGAKYSCALKAMTAAVIAWEAAILSLEGLEVPSDGIIEDDIEKSIKNLKIISQNMKRVDDAVIDILKKRNEDI